MVITEDISRLHEQSKATAANIRDTLSHTGGVCDAEGVEGIRNLTGPRIDSDLGDPQRGQQQG